MSNRRKQAEELKVNVCAELNCSLGQVRESQHWIVALNAPQTEDEEPEPARLAN